jgi:thioredoxin-like negative regulator of GroEL
MSHWPDIERIDRVCHVVMCAAGVVCALLPLTGILGYESSMVAGALGALGASVRTSAALSRWPGGPRSASLMRPVGIYVEQLLAAQAYLIGPLLILTLNMLRVPNCAPGLGLLYWLVIAAPAVVMGHTIAWVVACLPLGFKQRAALCVAVLLANAAAMGLHIALQPPVVGHCWLIGYFSGSIYDEALGLPTSLLYYRACNLVCVGLLVSAVEVWRRPAGKGAPLLGALLALACWIGLTWQEAGYGVRVDRATIVEVLGGRVETEHFIIYYPARRGFEAQRALLIEDHEFRYAQLKAMFKTDPVAESGGQKLVSFVYPDREVKGELMGARRTLIAKIWLGEMHILWRGYGDHLLTHELAHLFTAGFADGPLKLSTQRRVGVNMGLVEGIASAAQWPVDELTLHEASAGMRKLGLAPELRGLLGAGGFWSQASGRSYTLMGSFVRYLIDKHGIDKFKLAYPRGDFNGAYGRPVGELIGEWEQWLDREIKLDTRALDLVRLRFDKPAIFGKRCARVVAEGQRLAEEAQGRGELRRAIAVYEGLVGYDPGRRDLKMALAGLLVRAGEGVRAVEVLAALETDAELSAQERAQLDAWRGDLAWRSGAVDEAQAAYGRCAAATLDDELWRLAQVKRLALSRGEEARGLARAYLVEDMGETGLYDVMRWAALWPDDALARYLVGRRLWAAGRYKEAARELGAPLDDAVLEVERRRLLAQALTHIGQHDEAEKIWADLAQRPESRLRAEAREWRARLAFVRGQPLE